MWKALFLALLAAIVAMLVLAGPAVAAPGGLTYG